jgi:hypothetical protein
VWTCRESDVEKQHFDTRQYNHVVWSTPEDLREEACGPTQGDRGGAGEVCGNNQRSILSERFALRPRPFCSRFINAAPHLSKRFVAPPPMLAPHRSVFTA